MEKKIKSVQELPDWCLENEKTLTGEGFYDADKYGFCIGRIEENKRISAFKKDKENNNTELLDRTIKELKTITKHKSIISEENSLTYADFIYLQYAVVDHSAYKPTVTDEYVDNCSNVVYEVTYEVGFAAGDELTRYVTFSYQTSGTNSSSPFNDLRNLEDNLEEFFDKNTNGFWIDDGDKYVWFYDNIGNNVDVYIRNVDELLDMVCSFRVIEIKKTITE